MAWFSKTRWTMADGWKQKEPKRSEHPIVESDQQWKDIKNEAEAYVNSRPELLEHARIMTAE